MMRNSTDMIDRIFTDRKALMGSLENFPETDEAMSALYDYLEGNCLDSHAQLMEAEDYLLDATAAYERQGFLYGFRYAVQLLMDALAIRS